ncbi:hypothetical protein [Salipiger thiooxidans]|uniref:hypothetical protein n=1 Tax=Salipiger thiooxidans TaxID=282683 RepID=UPI001CFA88C7|nr:hypothetical protein [Salipiger thiooxidans]
MLLLLTVCLLLYAAANLVVNSMIVSAATYDVALVNQIVLSQLQGFTEFVTTLGLSLVLLRFYILRLPQPERFTVRRATMSAAIIAAAFFVLLPLQQRAVQEAAKLASPEMRRAALVLSVTNYGLVAGDVTMPQLGISKDDLRAPPVQTLFPLLNPILLYSGGFEIAEADIEPISRTIIRNGLARNNDIVEPSFNAAMDASCAALRDLYRDYTRASNVTASELRARSDGDAVRQEWFAKADQLFEKGADIPPQLGQDEFLEHPVVQAKITATVEGNLRSLEFPDFLSALGTTSELADYAKTHMAEKITNPCATTWASFVADGGRDSLIDDLVAYYAQLVREDYERLGENGDLSEFGRAVMLYAVAPTFGIAMTWLVAVLQVLTAASIITRYYVPVRASGRAGVMLVLLGLLVLWPAARMSDAEQSSPGLQERFAVMSESESLWAPVRIAGLAGLLRAEETIFPLGVSLRCLTPLRAFDMFGNNCG